MEATVRLLTAVAAMRSSLHTRRAAILHPGRIPLPAGVTRRRLALTLLRQAAAMAAEALRIVMAVVAGLRVALVAVAALAAEVTAVGAIRAVVEGVIAAGEAGRTGVAAAIRIANLRF